MQQTVQQTVTAQQLLPHIRVVLGIILGLSVTTLLKGLASIIEHPRRFGWSLLHVSWAAWALLSVVAFWWWEFSLTEVRAWTFGPYLFVIAYFAAYFLLAALLFPSDIREYGSYEDYLLQRRHGFFAVLALVMLMDLVDTALKGEARWRQLGVVYPIRTAAMLLIAGLGAWTADRRAQQALALIALVSSVAYFTWQYFAVTAEAAVGR
jgi:hypothetical protein